MKRVLIVLLLILVVIAPAFSRDYTEEEFREVYNALASTNELLKEKQAEVESLYERIDELLEVNDELKAQLESTIKELESSDKLLQEVKKQLEKSNKVIETLNNQNWLVGAHVGLNNWQDLSTVPTVGCGINFGYKAFLGYFTGSFSFYTDKSYTLSAGYSFIF